MLFMLNVTNKEKYMHFLEGILCIYFLSRLLENLLCSTVGLHMKRIPWTAFIEI